MNIKKIMLASCLSLSLLIISPLTTANTKLQDIITKAEQGDAHAQFNLGIMYYSGLEIEQDYNKAIAWFSKASEQGNSDAQFALGTFYHEGIGVKQDYKKAFELISKAAEKGHAGAQGALGVLYYTGAGVKKDLKLAREYFRKACKGGSEQGCKDYSMLNEKDM